MDVVSLACKEILQQISIGKIADTQGLARAKIQACREFGISKPPSNSEILAAATVEERKKIIQLLRLKPVRSISGVSVITVMSKPYPCPKEEPCIYCPGGPSSGTPQSYTGREPAAMRAIQHNFDPYQQVKGRIEQLRAIGHDVDKVELIIFGGTLTAYPQDYLEWFVTQCLNAMSSANAKTIEEAQVAAENSKIRISDIAFETRPDYCKESHVDLMLRLGATRVELGVQTVHEDIYKLVDRGHTVEDVVEATRIARDAGFAVTYHVMLGLVGSSFDRDLEMFRLLFENQDFMPDALKVYPCLVLKDTKLYELWKSGKF
jgi:elongator complex protein 3